MIISQRCLHMYRNWIIFHAIKSVPIVKRIDVRSLFRFFTSKKQYSYSSCQFILLSFIDFFCSFSHLFFSWAMCVNDCGKEAVKILSVRQFMACFVFRSLTSLHFSRAHVDGRFFVPVHFFN